MLTSLMHKLDLNQMPSLAGKGMAINLNSNPANSAETSSEERTRLLHQANARKDSFLADTFLRVLSRKPHMAWDICSSCSTAEYNSLLQIVDDKSKFFLMLSKALQPYRRLHANNYDDKIDKIKAVNLDFRGLDLRGLNTMSFMNYLAKNKIVKLTAQMRSKISADFSGAQLDRAYINCLNLAEANFEGASLFGASLDCLHIGKVNLDNTNLIKARVNDLASEHSVKNADIRYAKFTNQIYRSYPDFTGSNASVGTQFFLVNPRGEMIKDKPKADLKLAGKDLRRRFYTGMDLSDVDLTDQNIAGAIIDAETKLANSNAEAIAKLESTSTARKFRMNNRDRENLGRLYSTDPNAFLAGVPNS